MLADKLWIYEVLLGDCKVIFGTFWLFPWGNVAADIAAQEGLQALENSTYLFDARGVLLGTVIQVLFLFTIIGISVLKPWGRRTVKALQQTGLDSNKPS